MFEKLQSFQLPDLKIAAIQVPALVAGASLVVEGLLTAHPIGALFQLLPIFVSAAGAYYAWIGGFYFVACLYLFGGMLAILAFSSIRFLVNIPAIGIFAGILLLPGLREGPQRDLFAMLQVPTGLLQFGAFMLIASLILVQRLNFPRLFMVSLGLTALSLAAALYIMVENFHWVTFQRLLSVGAGGITLFLGYLYYNYSAARRAEDSASYEEERAVNELRENYRAELKRFLLELEEVRKELHLRPRWLQSACVESGVIGMYDTLVKSGEVESEPLGAVRLNHGPRAPVRGDGIKSDPYEILGLRPGASLEEIKEAYSCHVRVYDPKKLETLSPDLRRVFSKMSDAVTRAYGALTKT